MKKILFISNICDRITNFAIPSIDVWQHLGYEFHMAANFSDFKDDASKYNIILHQIDFVRNLLNYKNIKACKQMLTLLKKEKFYIIHCNTPIGGILGRLCGKIAKVEKIVYTAHGFHFYKGAPLINKTLFKWIEMRAAHYTDAIITINQEDYKAAQKFKLRKGGKIYYIPGVGVDISTIRLAVSKREELIKELRADNSTILLISVGELNKNKNNKVIIKALGVLQCPKIHYILCGVGNKRDELKALAKNYNIEENIHFLGYRTDVFQLLKSCDIFVMPSYREGLSRSMMEAMASGIPCIASKIRGNTDLIEDGKGGYLLEPDDIIGFSKAIHMLATDVVLSSQMSICNIETVKRYDVFNIKQVMNDTYKEILEFRGG